MFFNKKFIAEDDKTEAKRVIYDAVEKLLDGNDWIAGDTLTIADFHYIASISTIKVRFIHSSLYRILNHNTNDNTVYPLSYLNQLYLLGNMT